MTTSSLASLLGVSGSSGLPIGAYAQFPAGAPTLIQQGVSEFLLNGAVVDYAAKYADAVAKAPWIVNNKLPASAFAAQMTNIVKSGSYCVGLASGGIRRSTDMTNWETIAVSGIGSSPYSLCASGNYLCAGNSTTSIIYSANNGASWAAIPTTALAAAPKFILRANNTWAAFTATFNGTQSEYATQSAENPGAYAWTVRNQGSVLLNSVSCAAASPSLFVLGGSNNSDSSGRIYTSADAVSWTLRHTATSSVQKIVYTGAKFFAIVTSGRDLVSSATGSGTWATDANKPVSSNEFYTYLDICSDGAGVVVAITTESGVVGIRVSTDHGVTWSPQKTLSGTNLSPSARISFVQGLSLAIVYSGSASYIVDYSAIGQARWVGTTEASTAAPGVSYVRIL